MFMSEYILKSINKTHISTEYQELFVYYYKKCACDSWFNFHLKYHLANLECSLFYWPSLLSDC